MTIAWPRVWLQRTLIFLILAGGTSCSLVSSTPIDFGHDACHSCKMTITDKRFGGEVVLKKGKAFKFDSLECMSPFLREHQGDIGKIYVLNSDQSGSLISADKAVFVIDSRLKSPMGKGILASPDEAALRKFFGSPDNLSKVYKWNDLATQLQITFQPH